MTDLLLGTTNAGKQREFRRLLAGLPGRVVSPQEIGLGLEVPEPHHTYADNATAKAAAYCAASGLITVADDSGIEAAALGWGPGVRSARFGDQAAGHADRMLAALADATDRRARMVCALAVATPGDDEPTVEVFTGVMEGTIASERRGTGGFGYDPIFLLAEGITTAELPEGEKDRISHRGRAVAAATPYLRQLLSAPAR
ncbi:MAG TPA: non-canonical purine NTP pyrophosphatase [Candidatus Limnocylindrales bacterium]|nr:non-canonical purine NTP pyrophosphatase [Candidatus Limnocylindrales bacterium]